MSRPPRAVLPSAGHQLWPGSHPPGGSGRRRLAHQRISCPGHGCALCSFPCWAPCGGECSLRRPLLRTRILPVSALPPSHTLLFGFLRVGLLGERTYTLVAPMTTLTASPPWSSPHLNARIYAPVFLSEEEMYGEVLFSILRM